MDFRAFKLALAVALAGALACCTLLIGCSQGSKTTTTASQSSSGYITAVDASDAYAKYGSGKHHAVLTVEGYDPITIELEADAAPVSVWNFCKLASEGYYDGLTFYRFMDGFCMQGGSKGNSPQGIDTSVEPIVGEFSRNGVSNPLADDFKKGTVAMARTSDPNSARTTFFITLDSNTMTDQSLNSLYAAFGTVDDAGMKVVDKIVSDSLPSVSDPSSGVIADGSKQPKIASIKIAD